MKRSSTGDKQLFSDDGDRKGEDEEGDRTISGGPTQIMNPLASDILLGRGRPYQEHQGNARFLRVIILYRDQYSRARKREDKASIADEILTLLKMDKNDPGRFLRRLENGEEGWVEVNDSIARDKVCHALRAKRRERKIGTQVLHLEVNKYLSPDTGAQQRVPRSVSTSGSSTIVRSGGALGSVEVETLLGSMRQSIRGRGGLLSPNLISDHASLLLAHHGAMTQPAENEPAAIFRRILNNRRQELMLSQQEDGDAEQEETLLQRVLVVLAQQQARPGGASLAQDALLGATTSIDSEFPEAALRNKPLLMESVSRSLAAARSMPLPPAVIAGGNSGGIFLALSEEAFIRQQHDIELARQFNRIRSALVSPSVGSRPGTSGLLAGYLLPVPLQQDQSPRVLSQNTLTNSSLRLAGIPPQYHPSTNTLPRSLNWPLFLPSSTRTNQEKLEPPYGNESRPQSIRQKTTAAANAASSTAEQIHPAR